MSKYAPNKVGPTDATLVNSEIIEYDKRSKIILDIPEKMPTTVSPENFQFSSRILESEPTRPYIASVAENPDELSRQIHNKLSNLSVQDRVAYERSILPECCSPTCLPVNAPSNLIFTQTTTSSILLTWVDNSNNELGFVVYKSINSGSTWNQIDSVVTNVTFSIDTNIVTGSTYWYRVNAYNDCTSSEYSNVYSGTIGDLIISSSVSESFSNINTTLHFGSLSPQIPNTDPLGISQGFLTGELIQMILPTSSMDSSSVESLFYTGSVITVILTTSSFDSGSVESLFYTGSIVTVILSPPPIPDSGSIDSAFYTGSLVTTVTIAPPESEPTFINVGLLSGSLS